MEEQGVRTRISAAGLRRHQYLSITRLSGRCSTISCYHNAKRHNTATKLLRTPLLHATRAVPRDLVTYFGIGHGDNGTDVFSTTGMGVGRPVGVTALERSSRYVLRGDVPPEHFCASRAL